MFKASRLTLTAAAVIAAASPPSAALARSVFDPGPRGVATVVGPVLNAVPNADQRTPQTGDAGAGHRGLGVSVPRCPRIGPCIPVARQAAPASTASRPAQLVHMTQIRVQGARELPGGAGPLYPGTTVTRYPGVVPGTTTTRYPGVVPGRTTTRYPGVVPQIGEPAVHSGETSRVQGSAVGTSHGGFDWSDGAIGALVVLGVMALGFGATMVVRRRTGSLARTES